MDKRRFYPRMALVNLARNGQFYVPYLLTVMKSVIWNSFSTYKVKFKSYFNRDYYGHISAN